MIRLCGCIDVLLLANKLKTVDISVSEGGIALARFLVTRHIDMLSVYLKKIFETYPIGEEINPTPNPPQLQPRMDG